MKAVRITSPGNLAIEEVAIPQINDDEILLKVAYGGICGSDIHIYHGNNERVKYPLIMCHEMSGKIAEVGQNCTGWEIGEKVTVNPLHSCGVCHPCKHGNKHVCKKLGLVGIDMDGAFAQYVKVKPEQLLKLPPSIDLDIAALAEPLAVGVHAVNRSGFKMGDKVVVLGGGPIGLMVGLAAKAAGASLVAVSEISEFRLKKAENMGFLTIDARENVKEKVLELTGGVGADIVFEAAAAPSTTAQMTDLVRIRGTLMIVGVHKQPIPVDLRTVNLRELHIAGTRVYTEEDFAMAVKLLPQINELSEVITHNLPLDAYQKGFNAMLEAKDSLKVLLRP